MKHKHSAQQRVRYILPICLLFAVFFTVQAQRFVTGRIADADTGEPIPFASVYIAGTTVGATTGDHGDYQLKLLGSGSYELVVSHVGYEPVFQKLDINRALIKLDISMKIRELKDVTVTAKRIAPRKQDVELFWTTLLGTQPSKTIYPINPKDVYFFFNAETNELKVSCPVPIEIANLEMGYRLVFTVQSFFHDYEAGFTKWSGRIFFKEMIPKTDQQKLNWDRNRIFVYSISINHFIRALYQESLLQEGFLLNYIRIHYVSDFIGINLSV